MGEWARQARWIFYFRVVALSGAALLLATATPGDWQFLAGLLAWAVSAMAFWSLPWWVERPRESERWAAGRAVLTVLEAIALGFGVAAIGGPASPLLLLYVPLLVQAASSSSAPGYWLMATFVVSGFAAALGAWLAGGAEMARWTPVALALAGLTIWAVGHLGSVYRRARSRQWQSVRHLRGLFSLLEHLPLDRGQEREFWRGYLDEVRTSGHFASAAVIRWDGLHPCVYSNDRTTAWQGLVDRHRDLLRRRSLQAGLPELFLDNTRRSIVCWPIPRGGLGPGTEGPLHPQAVGLLCVLSTRRVSLADVERKLSRWLPLAALALGAPEPPVTRGTV